MDTSFLPCLICREYWGSCGSMLVILLSRAHTYTYNNDSNRGAQDFYTFQPFVCCDGLDQPAFCAGVVVAPQPALAAFAVPQPAPFAAGDAPPQLVAPPAAGAALPQLDAPAPLGLHAPVGRAGDHAPAPPAGRCQLPAGGPPAAGGWAEDWSAFWFIGSSGSCLTPKMRLASFVWSS